MSFKKLTDEQIKELISRRRRQILVHSSIYYNYDTNIITDAQFDKFCNDLIKLQKEYPHLAQQCVYHEEFKKLEHASGFDLPYNMIEIRTKAMYLMKLRGLV